ncbi:hypothetical protein [Pararobbsia alpina]|uniref:JAB domain-containing protein n=1 Tax=Pararobbsia alpina TaxID=621374 RepID=A0A6S7BES5_9BURK|nr:hypothetical protein [Pararobbsia alpina]CAB3797125.1 hypothetical protein LMG28138_04193 [Pararobbsia alpina]
MSATIVIGRALLNRIHADLDRPHAFAAERGGFLTCRSESDGSGWTIRSIDYDPVPDVEYVNVPSVGAAVKGSAFRRFQMKAHSEPVSIFHIHRHDHHGTPRFSSVDRQEGHRFVPDFMTVRRELPHGIVVLSYDAAHALVWLPEDPHAAVVGEVALAFD